MTTETEKPQMKAASLMGELLEAWRTGKRWVWLEGGTYASKTYTTMQFLKLIAENHPQPLHMTVISETMPHLKQGAILDFKNIMGSEWDDNSWNATDFIYTWPTTKTWTQFLSADQPSKAAGPRRDVLFANELNHIVRETFKQADMRTHLFTIADWNPESEFWFHEEECYKDENDEFVLKDNERGLYIKTNYLDALQVMPSGKRQEIEDMEFKDPNGWRVYGLGLLGKITGLVYPNFKIVDELPGKPILYGLDYGALADPTVCTAHYIEGDNLYSDELFYIYDAEITNEKISMEMRLAGVDSTKPLFPDPNEPKSATELRNLGWRIGETVKGKGSVEYGIKAVNNYYQHWTSRSVNCIKEQRNFRYLLDRNGEMTDNTTHKWSHGMASRRYPIASYMPNSGNPYPSGKSERRPAGGSRLPARVAGYPISTNRR